MRVAISANVRAATIYDASAVVKPILQPVPTCELQPMRKAAFRNMPFLQPVPTCELQPMRKAAFRNMPFLQPVPTCELQPCVGGSIPACFIPSTSANVRAATLFRALHVVSYAPSTSANVRAATDFGRCVYLRHGTFNQCQRASCNYIITPNGTKIKTFNQCQRASCNGKNAQNTDHARIIVCILTFSSARPSSKMKKNGCYLDLGTGRRPDRR